MKNVVALAYASVIVGAALIFSGCSAGGEAEDSDALSFVISDPTAFAAFEGAAADLQLHTGVHLKASVRGTTVHAGPRPEGRKTCADTTVDYFEDPLEVVHVDIALYVPVPAHCYDDLALTLAHEAIHAVRAWTLVTFDHLDDDHSESGVFSAYARDPRFDASSLTKFCEAVTCPQFETE